MAKGKYARKRLNKKLRETSINDSGLSTRVVNLLGNAGIHNLASLMRESDDTLSSLPGIGEAAMEEIHRIKNKFFSINNSIIKGVASILKRRLF